MAEKKPPPPTSSSKPPPTITLPPRYSIENFFAGGPGASPGPMSLVSSFFAESDSENDCRSFSQLLAGAMSSPAAVAHGRRNTGAPEDGSGGGGGGGGGSGGVGFRFQQNRPVGLVVSHPPGTVTIPPGLSPASLLDSPDYFSSSQVAFGMSHQQFLSQVAQAHSQAQMQMQYPSLSAAPASSLSQLQPVPPNVSLQQQILPPLPAPKIMKESSNVSHSDQKFHHANVTVDKPTDDGYNWRKYGQKQVKGSEFPRSYYKCTHPNCPVKKKVERSLDGQITEIIYKGQHSHPQSNKRTRDGGNTNGTIPQEFGSDEGGCYLSNTKDQGSGQVTPENVSGSSESEGEGNGENRVNEGDEAESESKRRNVEVQNQEQASSHRTVTEPRIIVQTTSEIDLLDDGYRWRKYGQKVVKGNPYPRSYYKCTSAGCNVRKHVERAATDPKAVITTYEGKHTHEVPAARNSSHNNASQLRPHNPVVERSVPNRGTEFGNEQQAVALLRFKEEQIT